MPGVFAVGESHLIGFAVGVCERSQILPKRDEMLAGDVLIGLPSSGPHSNGFSLIRSIVSAAGVQYRTAAPFDPTCSLGEALLTPPRMYNKAVLALARAQKLKGALHISDGGLVQCIPRVLPPGLLAELQADSWELPALFRWLAAQGKITSREIATTFNCGIGMVLVVAREHADEVMQMLRGLQEEPVKIGTLLSRPTGSEGIRL